MSEVKDLSSLHKYRTELPNIIFHLGLDTYELAAYSVLKRTAGDKGFCTKSMKTLASEIGCSEAKLKQIKKSLAIPRDLLNGQSLINIYIRKTEIGDPDTDLIEIEDIWPINFDFFKPKEIIKGGSPKSPPILERVRRHVAHPGPLGSPKEEPIKEEPKEEVVCSAPAPRDPAKELKVEKTTPQGTKIVISQEAIFAEAIRSRESWRTDEIFEAWKILVETKSLIRDGYAFIKGTIENLQLRRKQENCNRAKGKKECHNMDTAQKPRTWDDLTKEEQEERERQACLGQDLAKRLFQR